MRAYWLIAVLAASCSPAASGPKLEPPLDPANHGELQCYNPDVARKTCQSLAAYRSLPDGAIDNSAVVLVAATPLTIMRANSIVELKEGQVCGSVGSQDIDSASFTVAGAPADAGQTATLRDKLKSDMRASFGHLVCTAFLPSGAAFLAEETIDGVRQLSLDQKMIWISPNAGYTVGP